MKTTIKYWKYAAAAAAWCIISFSAKAFVVQDPAQAMSFNNYAGGFSSTESAASTVTGVSPEFHDYSGNMVVDNQGIAEKLLGKSKGKKLSVDFTTINKLHKIEIPQGYMLEVILPTTDGSKWYIEYNHQYLEEVGESLENKRQLLQFMPQKSGQVMVYFDNMTIAAPTKLLQNRVLQIRILP